MNRSFIESVYKKAGVDLSPVGDRWVSLCPFHKETKPSFYVFPDGGYKCFGCGVFGSIQEFIDDDNDLNLLRIDMETIRDKESEIVDDFFKSLEVDLKKAVKKKKFNKMSKAYDNFDRLIIYERFYRSRASLMLRMTAVKRLYNKTIKEVL